MLTSASIYPPLYFTKQHNNYSYVTQKFYLHCGIEVCYIFDNKIYFWIIFYVFPNEVIILRVFYPFVSCFWNMIAARFAKVEGPHYAHCWCSRLSLQSLLLCGVCIEGNGRPAIWFFLLKYCVGYTPRTSVCPCEIFYVMLIVNTILVIWVYTIQFFSLCFPFTRNQPSSSCSLFSISD